MCVAAVSRDRVIHVYMLGNKQFTLDNLYRSRNSCEGVHMLGSTCTLGLLEKVKHAMKPNVHTKDFRGLLQASCCTLC